MPYDIFSKYGLDTIHDFADHDEKDAGNWQLVATKTVMDSDGFNTEYSWYTDGTRHIFMFGDTDLVEPDPDYADWEAESEATAQEWFDNYHGFAEDEDFEEDILDDTPRGNANFMNEGFARVYGVKSITKQNRKSIHG